LPLELINQHAAVEADATDLEPVMAQTRPAFDVKAIWC